MMKNIWEINISKVKSLLTFRKFDLNSIMFVRRSALADFLLCCGLLIAYWGSMHPWFMWRFDKIYYLAAPFLMFLSFYISRGLKDNMFKREQAMIPTCGFLMLDMFMKLVNHANIFGFIASLFHATIVYFIFRLENDKLRQLSTFLCKAMACLLCVSISFYILFLIGFALPHYHIDYKEWGYSYENYRFFLLDDRAIMLIIPRFHSVFLEPGHLGTACTFLLLTQIGRWKRWYNIVLIVSTAMTFSLAGYVLLIMTYFASAWIKRKAIFRKVLILVSVFAAIAVGSIFYNKGDNMVNMLIVQRLTIDQDGKLEGDNRATDLFKREFDNFMQSDDILTGREFNVFKFGWGNAGYRVFIYDNGLISVFILLMFYFSMTLRSYDKRAKLVMWGIFLASFLVRSTPLAYYYLIPLYFLAYNGSYYVSERRLETKKQTNG